MNSHLSGMKNMKDKNILQDLKHISRSYFPELFPGDIHIWYAFYHNNDKLVEKCSNALTSDESEHISYYKFLKDQNSFIVSRGLLRILLSAYLHISTDELCLLKHSKGKPYQLNDPNLFLTFLILAIAVFLHFQIMAKLVLTLKKFVR